MGMGEKSRTPLRAQLEHSPTMHFSVVYIGIGLNKSIDMIQFYSNFAASAADL